ncbi:MAG: TRAFs-binding domain-containing protein, partial [Desulfobulbaceae bacterium]|nr:TRAFs-binding domain-containing protein [Desulfobulbaceae bacterium]
KPEGFVQGKISQEIDLAESATVDHLVSLWHSRDHELWQTRPNLYLIVGKRMLSAGEPLLAYDILSEGVEKMGGKKSLGQLTGDQYTLLIFLLQQQALSLAQSGASEEANAILRSLQSHGMNDSETMGILGRTCKDMAMHSKAEGEREKYLQESFECYNSAFTTADHSGNPEEAYYTGINAAAVSHFAGNRAESKKIAARVENVCLQILERKKNNSEPVSFWLYASLGEASLLQDDIAQAKIWYKKAAGGCSEDIRALGSMRRQARLILEYAGHDKTILDHCFSVPSVILFSGHIIDTPERKNKRFPSENEDYVRLQIRQWLDKVNGKIGFSSAACGSDIIFLEEMLKRNGEINIVLPFDKKSFAQTSVNVVPENKWIKRFERVIRKAKEVIILSQHNEKTLDDDLFFTNLYLYGTAQVRAEKAGTDLKTLLVWDGNKAQSMAGTAALADLIENKGGVFDIIHPQKKSDRDGSAETSGDTKSVSIVVGERCNWTTITIGKRQARHHAYLPLMIADVKGYSRLDKREKLFFASNFMGEMADVLQPFENNILGKKTQGDSLFLVFNDLQSCVKCAQALTARTLNVDWTSFGMSSQLTMRISLDAGPCYSYSDPITGTLDFCGDYIVRAARLEPVTPPGNIYASETFVAVAKAYDIEDIQFKYAGQVELPKGFGKMQAFHVK